MAISNPVLVQNFYDTANRSQYNGNTGTSGTGTFSLVAGRRYYVAVHSFSTGPAEAVTIVRHDPTGTPTDFTRVTDGTTSARITGYGVTGNTLELWEANITSTTATAFLRVEYAGTQSACGFGVFYLDGEDDTNTSVQVKILTGTGTLPGVTMNSFGATDNLALLVVARDDVGAALTVTESRTKLYENDETERNNHAVFYQNPHGGDVSLNASITSDNWAAIGVEVRAGGGGPVAVAGTDTATLSEARLTTVAWTLTDTGTVTDTQVTLATVTPIGDSGTTSDALTALTVATAPADSGALTDTLTALDAPVAGVDLGSLTDVLTSMHTDVGATDTLTVAEASVAELFPSGPNAIAANDALAVLDLLSSLQTDATGTEAATGTDSLTTLQVDVVVADAFAIADATGTVPLELVAVDAGTVTDAAAWAAAWTASDSLTVTDTGSASFGGALTGELEMGAADIAPRLRGGP